jgi:hypothetical protein
MRLGLYSGKIIVFTFRANFKTSHFGQSQRWAQILILEILNVFLRLKFSPALTLTKLKRFETGSFIKNFFFKINVTGRYPV